MKVRTLEAIPTPQGEIPAGRIVSIPDHLLERLREKVEPVPVLPPGMRSCYCCKGVDYWLARTEKYPHWVCRKCHPPAPSAERQAD